MVLLFDLLIEPYSFSIDQPSPSITDSEYSWMQVSLNECLRRTVKPCALVALWRTSAPNVQERLGQGSSPGPDFVISDYLQAPTSTPSRGHL